MDERGGVRGDSESVDEDAAEDAFVFREAYEFPELGVAGVFVELAGFGGDAAGQEVIDHGFDKAVKDGSPFCLGVAARDVVHVRGAADIEASVECPLGSLYRATVVTPLGEIINCPVGLVD